MRVMQSGRLHRYNTAPGETAEAALLEREDVPSAISDRARSLLRMAESRLQWLSRIESLFFGLSLGSVLLLSAIGLAIELSREARLQGFSTGISPNEVNRWSKELEHEAFMPPDHILRFTEPPNLPLPAEPTIRLSVAADDVLVYPRDEAGE